MRELRMDGGVFRPAPPHFAAVWMAPRCVFYAHYSAVRQGVEQIEREVREGRMTLPDGMTAAAMTINQQAWALARTNVAGSA